MSRMFLPSVLKPRYQGGFSPRRVLALAVLFVISLLAAAPFGATPPFQAQAHDGEAEQNQAQALVSIISPDLEIQSPDAKALDSFGSSVSNAGDFNGDGSADIVVGCVHCDVETSLNAGKAFVFLGGPLDDQPDLTLQSSSPETDDFFGMSVSGIGNIDGDLFDDIVIGCSRCNEGQAFIFFGASEMKAVTFLTLQIPSSEEGGGVFGNNFVSHAGDVNGDGFGDVILGCNSCTVGKAERAGKAFIFLGGL